MNDYLCAVLLDETYNHQSKYNNIRGEGVHLKKYLKARILVVRSTGFSFAYKFRYSFSGKQNPNITAPLTHKEGSQQSFADIKSNTLLNTWSGLLSIHLPTMSQSRELKLNGGKNGRKLSLGGRGFLSTFLTCLKSKSNKGKH